MGFVWDELISSNTIGEMNVCSGAAVVCFKLFIDDLLCRTLSSEFLKVAFISFNLPLQ